MSRQKTAAFLVDCLSNMPEQPGEVKAVVNTAIAGVKRIADGGDWPEDEARAAMTAAYAAARAADEADAAAYSAATAAAWSADWVANWAAYPAYWAADWAAKAHPDPDAERVRQEIVRKELGL